MFPCVDIKLIVQPPTDVKWTYNVAVIQFTGLNITLYYRRPKNTNNCYIDELALIFVVGHAASFSNYYTSSQKISNNHNTFLRTQVVNKSNK